jgi:hypothetical protein
VATDQQLPNYELIITNGDNLEITLTQTIQLNVQVFENGKLLSPTPSQIIYTSSDNSIAEVSDTGVIQPINEGEVEITASYGNVNSKINVDIVTVVADNFTYEIVGEDSIIKNYTKRYVAKKYNNGILVEDAPFEFSIIADNVPVNAYTLTVVDGKSCDIKANANTYYITLRATDKIDSSQYFDKIILLKSRF